MYFISWRIILLVIGFTAFIVAFLIRKRRKSKLIQFLNKENIEYDEIRTAPGSGMNLIINRKLKLFYIFQAIGDTYKSRKFEWNQIEQIRIVENHRTLLTLPKELSSIENFELTPKAKADTILFIEFKIQDNGNTYQFKFGAIPHSTLERIKYLEMAVEMKEWLQICSELLSKESEH